MHLNTKDLSFVVPAAFSTALLIGSDTALQPYLPKSPNTIRMAANASTAGMAALLGTGAGLFVWGQATHDQHKRETGLLTGEAAIDAYAAATAIKYMTQRERPNTGNGKGSFLYGGDSFPSDTAAVSWAAATVIAHEYPGTLTQVLAYGLAGGVTAGRIISQKHWMSDAVIGSALGWYMGWQIYRARSQDRQIEASTWGTFEKSPDEQVRDPAYMGTTYMPLDSWIYPAFDRLEALGYVPTLVAAAKPWARMQCARLTLEAQQQMAEQESSDPISVQTVAALREEFAMELREIEGARNVGAQFESVYARIGGISGRPLRDSYNFAQTLYDDFGRPYGEGFNAFVGASARAQAGPLAFYVRGEYQTSSSITNYTPAQQLRLAAYDNLPVAGVPTFPAVNRFRTLEAYVALNVNNWQLSFGQQSAWWGSTYGSSLILSDNAEAMPMLKVTRVIPYVLPGMFAWFGQIRNTFFIGSMRGYNYLRGPYPDFELVGNAYQSINPQPYTWGDKLALKMTSNFEIGVSVSVLWAGQMRPATMHTWLHTFSTQGNFQADDPGKRYTGFNFSYRLPKLRNWVQLYADGMSNDEPNPIRYPRQSAWNAGLYFPQLPTMRNMDLRVEGIYTNLPGYPGIGPYYYNLHYAEGYRLYDQIIGSWIGRSGDGIQAWSTYWFSGQNKIQVGYRRQYNESQYLEGGGLHDLSAKVDWLVERDLQVSGTFQYERWKLPLLSATPQSNVAVGIQITYWPRHDGPQKTKSSGVSAVP